MASSNFRKWITGVVAGVDLQAEIRKQDRQIGDLTGERDTLSFRADALHAERGEANYRANVLAEEKRELETRILGLSNHARMQGKAIAMLLDSRGEAQRRGAHARFMASGWRRLAAKNADCWHKVSCSVGEWVRVAAELQKDNAALRATLKCAIARADERDDQRIRALRQRDNAIRKFEWERRRAGHYAVDSTRAHEEKGKLVRTAAENLRRCDEAVAQANALRNQLGELAVEANRRQSVIETLQGLRDRYLDERDAAIEQKRAAMQEVEELKSALQAPDQNTLSMLRGLRADVAARDATIGHLRALGRGWRKLATIRGGALVRTTDALGAALFELAGVAKLADVGHRTVLGLAEGLDAAGDSAAAPASDDVPPSGVFLRAPEGQEGPPTGDGEGGA